MAFDWMRLPRVAWLVAFAHAAGCGAALRPPEPPPETGPVPKIERPHAAAGVGRHVVVGEMCPQGVAGRPAVAPLIMRAVQWSDAAADLSDIVERGSVPRFEVFGVDGKIAGVFDTIGLADIGLPQPIASGAYAGASACSAATGPAPQPGAPASNSRVDDARCLTATNGCGLAIGEIERPDDPPQTVAFTTGGACLSGDSLAVDIDGDGTVETFALSGVLDGIRGPASEWTAQPIAGAACKPSFQLYDVTLAPEAEPGKPVDTKAIVKLDVLGVVDLDGDGRRELILALRFPTVRSIVVYSPTGSQGRLELVGEGPSFPR